MGESSPEKKKTPNALQHFLGGTVGGIAGTVASYPFDTVRIRMQTQDYNNPRYKGMIDCFRKMIRQEGATSLYRGVLSPVAGTAFIKATVFGAYGALQNGLATIQPEQEGSWVHRITASFGSGVIAAAVVTPVERVKVAMQTQSAGAEGAYRSVFHCVADQVKTHGVRNGLYRGLGATISRDAPSYGLYFLSYQAAKDVLVGDDPNPSKGSLAVAGAVAGIMSWVPIYPIDVVKSRIQAGMQCNGVLDCARLTYQSEGAGAFFRGLTPTICRAIPCHAAVFAFYEMTIDFLM